jgi:pimeloyl-ACP methyl ester carboxylesterase
MPFFDHDPIHFHYRETGQGVPFVFQHGLGASVEQTFSLITPPDGFRMLTLDCRGHGKTEPLGDRRRIRIGPFAEDLLAWLDHLRVERAIVGGISMGAAVTLDFTLRFPERVMGLVQSRPAWLAEPNRRNAEWFGEIARLIRQHGAEEGAVIFRQSDTYRQLTRESPDVAQSMLNQFSNPRVEATAVTLEQMRDDAPCENLEQLARISIPTLVLANRQDPVHPFEFGQIIANAIPSAEFQEVTAKSVSVQQHQEDVQRHVGEFLRTHFGTQ